jgi:hypothetical protein
LPPQPARHQPQDERRDSPGPLRRIADDGTLIRLTHRGLPPELDEQHDAGWSRYLEQLATVVAGGDPGPDPSLTPPPA